MSCLGRLTNAIHAPPSPYLAALLIALHVWLAVGGSERVGATYDEPTHIVSGLYHHHGDFRFQPENGTLPQRIEALPWILAGYSPPMLSGRAWERADMWEMSHLLFEQAGSDSYRLLFWSRLLTAFVGAILLWVIYLWSSSLFGTRGGLITLGFAATCPNLLAHSGLSTSDTWGTLGLLLSTLAIWRVCHFVTPRRVLAAGGAAGLLALCKFNVLLLPLIATGLVMLRLLRRAPIPWRVGGFSGRIRGWSRLAALGGAAFCAAMIAITLIWAGYNFRYSSSPHPEQTFHLPFERMLVIEPVTIGVERLGETPTAYHIPARAGLLEKGLSWTRNHQLLPEAWIYGCAYVSFNARARQAYFAGEHHELGRPSYFPVALLLKTPVPGLLALLTTCLLWPRLTRRHGHRLYRLYPVVLLATVVMAVAIFSNVNIGLRHILPVIAALWLCVGALGAGPVYTRARRIGLGAAGLLIIAQAGITLRQFPHHLTFFNSLAGDQPDHWFVDSNLDWGQGLPELKNWLDRRGDNLPVFLSYFGTDSPKRHGITATRFADFHSDRELRMMPVRLRPGWYCFGPTQYRRAYGEIRGNWSLGREAKYQAVRARLAEVSTPAVELSPEARQLLLEHWELLSFARLCHYLSGQAPDHRLPGGMMVFRLDQTDLNIALHAPLATLNLHVAERLLATD